MRFYCWDDAAADFERGFALHAPADPNLWLSHAYLRLYAGDADGYRRVCAAMLDKFGQTTDPTTAMDIAQACTAGPDALPDYTRAIRLLDGINPDGRLGLKPDVQLARPALPRRQPRSGRSAWSRTSCPTGTTPDSRRPIIARTRTKRRES